MQKDHITIVENTPLLLCCPAALCMCEAGLNRVRPDKHLWDDLESLPGKSWSLLYAVSCFFFGAGESNKAGGVSFIISMQRSSSVRAPLPVHPHHLAAPMRHRCHFPHHLPVGPFKANQSNSCLELSSSASALWVAFLLCASPPLPSGCRETRLSIGHRELPLCVGVPLILLTLSSTAVPRCWRCSNPLSFLTGRALISSLLPSFLHGC